MGNRDEDSITTTRLVRSDVFRINVASLVALAIAAVATFLWFQLMSPPVARESLPTVTAPVICFLLLYWPIYVAIYLLWTHRLYSALDRDTLQRLAESDTRRNRSWLGAVSGLRRGGTDLTTAAATVAVLVTIVIGLTPGVREDTAVIILTMLMVAASWAMMVYGFALDYLRMTVTQNSESPHLVFSTTDEPEFGDFLTVAVMVSTMGSGLPAEVRSRPMWRRVRTNTILAFFFNSVIVAMMVALVFGGIIGA